MDLNFAIIGCGRIAPRHAKEICLHGRLVAVCDIITERATEFAKQYSATPYFSLDDLLEKEQSIDVVVICTPNGLHAEHSIKSLQAGHHVLCEKPLCITTAAAWQMMETAKFCRRKLFVVKSTRFNPALVSLKKLIDEKALGTLYSFQLNCFWNRPDAYYHENWRGTLFPDGGTLYTQFSHYIDAILWLLGDVGNLQGYRRNLAHENIIEFEDSGTVSLSMSNGMIGGINWSVNSFQNNMEVSFSLLAEKGSLRIGGTFMNEVEYAVGEAANLLKEASEGMANDYGSYQGSMSNHDKVYENLVRSITDEDHPFTGPLEGLKTVELIERIYNTIPLK